MTTESPPPDAYRRIAPWYDRVIGPFNSSLSAASRRLAAPETGDRVLDVGCGTGADLEGYVDAGCVCAGLDASESMLAVARERLGAAADLHKGWAQDLPFDDAAFDIVTASLFLHELDSGTRAMVCEEIVRVLRPRASVVITEFGHDDLTLKGRSLRALSMIAERLAGREHKQNCSTFLSEGGTPASFSELPVDLAQQRTVSGGNMTIYVYTRR